MTKKRTNVEVNEPPKVGDYVARREPLDPNGHGYVNLKTGPFTEQRIATCETFEEAVLLADLCNDTRDLVGRWLAIRTTPLFKHGHPEEWAQIVIAGTLCKALRINAAQDFWAALWASRPSKKTNATDSVEAQS